MRHDQWGISAHRSHLFCRAHRCIIKLSTGGCSQQAELNPTCSVLEADDGVLEKVKSLLGYVYCQSVSKSVSQSVSPCVQLSRGGSLQSPAARAGVGGFSTSSCANSLTCVLQGRRCDRAGLAVWLDVAFARASSGCVHEICLHGWFYFGRVSHDALSAT